MLIANALLWSANAQTTEKEWQAKAVQKYVALGVQGSDLNKRFVDAYTKRRKSDPAFFTNPRWPMLLADELMAPPSIPSREAPMAPTLSSQTSTPPVSATVPSAPSVAATPTRPRPTAVQAPVTSSESDFPTGLTIGFAIAVGCIGFAVLLSVAKAAARRKHYAHLKAEALEYVVLVKHCQSLPDVPTSVMLKSGETAFYSAPSALYETRAVRDYQAGHVGFRVAKGIYIGGSRGRSTSSQQWSKIDAGTLTVTNKRVIFDGASADRSVAINKILSADSSIDGVEISAESRQKSMVFAAANPLILATIIRICCQAADPLDLSKTTLEFTFTE